MQDTKNLKRKIKEYTKHCRAARACGDFGRADYWARSINELFKRIETRNKNRLKNEKKHRKAN
jgi:hypothetical protein